MTLHKLPRSFKSFVTTMTAGERTKPLTFEELGPLLLQEEAREKLFTETDDKALFVKNKPNKGKFKDSKKTEAIETKKKVKCFYCEKQLQEEKGGSKAKEGIQEQGGEAYIRYCTCHYRGTFPDRALLSLCHG